MEILRAVNFKRIVFAILLLVLVFSFGKRIVFAASPEVLNETRGLGDRIICRVFTDLNAYGAPIPHLESGDCPGALPPPPPPPPPSPPPAPACSNHVDDDGDSFVDENDPNCHTDGNPANQTSYDPHRSEAGSLPACWNNQDDDADGKKDLADPGCASAVDTSEADTGSTTLLPQCSNTLDDDGDGKVDAIDPGCHTDFNASNAASYDGTRTDEAASAPAAPQCSDNVDNDGDGKKDLEDPGCSSATDTDETDTSTSSGTTGTSGNSTNANGNSGSSGGGGGGGGGGGLPPGTSLYTSTGASTSPKTGIVLGFATTTESCDRYLTAFIKEGQDNDVDQVRRLQRFLRDYEGAAVSENGMYDSATLAAVHVFQTKYASSILTPWGIKTSTGFVYLTTRKKVNEIVCKNAKTFPLTIEEQRRIDETRRAGEVPSRPITPAKPSMPNTVDKKPENPQLPKEKSSSAATTTDNGQVEKTLRFFRGLFDRN